VRKPPLCFLKNVGFSHASPEVNNAVAKCTYKHPPSWFHNILIDMKNQARNYALCLRGKGQASCNLLFAGKFREGGSALKRERDLIFLPRQRK